MWELYEAVCKHALGWIIPPSSSQTCLLRDHLLFPWDIRELTEVLPLSLHLLNFVTNSFLLLQQSRSSLCILDPWSWKGSSL